MDYITKQNDTMILIEHTKKEVKKSVIEQFIVLRKTKHLTQKDISIKTGIARSNISRIESGKFIPTIDILTKLAIALDMDLDIRFVENNRMENYFETGRNIKQ